MRQALPGRPGDLPRQHPADLPGLRHPRGPGGAGPEPRGTGAHPGEYTPIPGGARVKAWSGRVGSQLMGRSHALFLSIICVKKQAVCVDTHTNSCYNDKKTEVEDVLTILNNVSPSCWESFCKLVSASPFEFITMLIAGLSAIIAFCAYVHQRRQSKKASACKLAQYYAESIIPRASYTSSVYVANKYAETNKVAFPLDKITSFSKKEMDRLISEAKKQLAIEETEKISPTSLRINKIIFASSEDERKMYVDMRVEENSVGKSPENLNAMLLQRDFDREVNLLLNDLEWFSMQCRYKVADEKLIYQSLHQVFLSEVQMLYRCICAHNINGEDKYYTNLIWLFNIWKKRLLKYRKKNDRARKKAQKQVVSATRKAEQAGETTHHGKSV